MRLTLACVLIVLGVLGTAACSDDPAVVKQRYRESGDRYAEGQKYAEAIIQYKNALAVDPRMGEVRFKLGNALVASGEGRAALDEFVRAADLLPRDKRVQLRAGEFLLMSRQFPEARARAAAVLEIDPMDTDGLLLMGNALAGLRDFEGAVTQLEQAVDNSPRRILAYQNLGSIQMAKGDQRAAEGAFKRAVELNPTEAAAHAGLGNYYWATGRISEAETELKAAYALDTKSPDLLKGLAAFYTITNRPAAAEEYLKMYASVAGDVGSQLTLADFYLGRGRAKEALPLLDTISKQQEGFASATIRLAALDYDAGDHLNAHKKLDAVLQREPKSESALVMKARFLLHEGKASEALTLTNRVLGTNARSIDALILQSTALDATGKKTEAIDTLLEALKQSPGNREAQVRLAQLYLARGQFDAAIELTAQILKAAPNLLVGRLMRAQAALGNLNFDAAERELAVLVKEAPKSAQVQSTYGDLCRLRKTYACARAAYSSALQLDPDLAPALTGLVAVDLAERKPDAARAKVASALQRNPQSSSVLMLAGMTYASTGDVEQAESSLKKAVEVDPANMAAYSKLANLYLAQRRLDDAVKDYEAIAKRRPELAVGATTMVGIIYELQGKPLEAMKAYEKALALDKGAAVAANNLAWAYAERGENLDLALELAQTAKSQMPDNAEVSDTLGWIYLKKGLAPLAITAFRQGTEQDRSNAVIHYHLGLAYMKDGQNERARVVIEHALKLNPKFAGADAARRELAQL